MAENWGIAKLQDGRFFGSGRKYHVKSGSLADGGHKLVVTGRVCTIETIANLKKVQAKCGVTINVDAHVSFEFTQHEQSPYTFTGYIYSILYSTYLYNFSSILIY